MAKGPSSSRSPRVVKEFVDTKPHERNNSKSLRHLLFDMLVRDFAGSTRDAAVRFRRLLRESRDRRKFRMHGKGLSEWSILRVAEDDSPITFSQLDAMAHHVGMPMGLVLLFSRIRSEVEAGKGDIEEARAILIAARVALEHLERALGNGGEPMKDVYKKLSHEVFEQFRAAYSEKFADRLDRLI